MKLTYTRRGDELFIRATELGDPVWRNDGRSRVGNLTAEERDEIVAWLMNEPKDEELKAGDKVTIHFPGVDPMSAEVVRDPDLARPGRIEIIDENGHYAALNVSVLRKVES